MDVKKMQVLIPIALFISTLWLSIGYASVNSIALNITGNIQAKAQEGIFISAWDISYDENNLNDDNSQAEIEKTDGTILTSKITLPEDNKDAFITYTITISNNTNKNYMFDEVTYLMENQLYDNSNIIFNLVGLEQEDKLLSKNSITFDVKFSYKDQELPDNNILNSTLNFKFKEIYYITYENIINNNYQSEIMQGKSTTIVFTDEIPEDVFVTGVESYTYENGTLTLNNALDNIIISNAVVFRHDGEYIFDGSNYIDTGVYLYSEENFARNFEVTFSIVNKAETQVEKATLFNSLDEANPDYPGVLFRVTNNLLNYEVLGNNKINGYSQVLRLYRFTDVNKVKMLRINGKTYYNINDGDYYELQDFTIFNEYFDIPATFGASLDSNGEPWRYFDGTLKDMKIKYLKDDYSIESFELEYNSVDNVTFDGTNYIDTGVYLFNEENINKDFDIIFTIKSYQETQNVYSTLMNSLDESNKDYPGIIFRFYISSSDASANETYTPTQYQFVGNGTTKLNKMVEDLTVSYIRIIRRDNVVYYSIDYGELVQLQDFSDFTSTFDVPVTFGGSLDADKSPYRYFKGVLSNIEVRIKR